MRPILIFIIFILCLQSLYSITDDDKKNIDNFIENKKNKDLDNFLKNNRNKENYKEYEDYIILKVKELVQKQKTEEAKDIIKIILDNNLDNEEAQDIYVSLEKIKKDKKEVNKKISFDNFIFTADIGPLDFIQFQSHFYNEHYGSPKWNVKYGLSGDLSFYFHYPYIAVGVAGFFDSYFASINPEKTSTEFFYRITADVSVPLIKVPIYLSFGFSHLIYNQFEENTPVDMYITDIKSLVIGLKLHRWFVHKYFGIDFSFYYYLVSPFTSYIDAAFDTSIAFLCRFYTIRRVGLIVKTEVIGFFLIDDGKLENNLKIQISFGVGINEK